MQSVVLPQYILQIDRPTDRPTNGRHNSRLCSLDRSDMANNIYTAIPFHWHDCRSPKHGPNPNPTHNRKHNCNHKS